MGALSAGEFAEFNALLATAAERGLPLEPVLSLLSAQAGSSRIRASLEAVHRGLKEGRSLPEALKGVDGFPADYVALVDAGQAAGRLPEVLRQASIHQGLRARFRTRFRRLLLYFALAGLSAFLLIVGAAFLSTRFTSGEELFRNIGIDYLGRDYEDGVFYLGRRPFAVVIGGVGALLGFGAVVLSVFAWASRTRFGYWIPVWGRLLRSRDLALFTSVAGFRLSAGAGAVEAFRSAQSAVPNRFARRRIGLAIRRLEEGATPSDALFYVRWFPQVLAWSVSLAERRGEVPQAFTAQARVHGSEVERAYEMVTVVLGPLGILLLGNVCLFLTLGILAPLMAIIRIGHFV